jgi:hypothetical protein
VEVSFSAFEGRVFWFAREGRSVYTRREMGRGRGHRYSPPLGILQTIPSKKNKYSLTSQNASFT